MKRSDLDLESTVLLKPLIDESVGSLGAAERASLRGAALSCQAILADASLQPAQRLVRVGEELDRLGPWARLFAARVQTYLEPTPTQREVAIASLWIGLILGATQGHVPARRRAKTRAA